jgi:hypothetical protein
MSEFYIDPDNGNDASDGTAWSSAWQTFLSGSTAARIAPGDTIRVAKSPDPTLVGNGRWELGPVPAAKNISSTVNTAPCRVIITDHGYSTGDVVYIRSHTTDTSANGLWHITTLDSSAFVLNDCTANGAGGATGTCTLYNSKTVLMDEAVTKTISLCEVSSEWSVGAAGGSTTFATEATSWREGVGAIKMNINADAGTGVIAYSTLPATLDLSGYQQVSLSCKTSTALNAGDFQLMLCSDATGTVPVDTLDFPYMVNYGSNLWMTITLNKYAALGSTINSIALNQVTDKGAMTWYMDDIIACKASSEPDSLTLNSLISKDSVAQGGTEGWYAIQSIKDRIIMLDSHNYTYPNNATFCYGGDSTTTALYKRECFASTMVSGATSVNSSTEAGTLGNVTTWSGGWDTTTTTQDGETFFDGRSGAGGNSMGHSYTCFDHLSFVRYYYGIARGGTLNDFTNTCTTGFCGGRSFYTSQDGARIHGVAMIGSDIGFQGDSNTGNHYVHLGRIDMCNGSAVYATTVMTPQGEWEVGSMSGNTVGWKGAANGGPATIRGCTFRANQSYDIATPTGGHTMSLVRCSGTGTWTITSTDVDSRIYSEKHDGIENNHYVLTDGGTITDQTTTVYTAGTPAWDFNLSNTTRTIYYPLDLKLARIPVDSTTGGTVTISGHFKKDHATNIGAALVAEGMQIGGMPDMSQSDATESTDWQDVTLTLHPTSSGEIEVKARTWYAAGTGHVYVDNQMEVTIS